MGRKDGGKKITKFSNLLKKSGVEVAEEPTNVLFVSNSSVLVGVSVECLESVFCPFDPNCSFFVYPTSKSYSFVQFSCIESAVNACNALNGTRPVQFPAENPPITLLYIKQIPKSLCSSKCLEMPKGLKIWSDFISDNLEIKLKEFVDEQFSSSEILKNRRVFHFGYTFNYTENNALDEAPPIPAIMDELIEAIGAMDTERHPRPNQITVNVYEPGQGIPLHTDSHSGFEEPIYSLSLLSDVVMEFRDCANTVRRSDVLLPRRSLMVLTDEARYRYKHGILTRKHDVHPDTHRLFRREYRISITFRTVCQTKCQCRFFEFCDWDREGRLRIPSTESEGKKLEEEYVSKVYEQIATHFDQTRHSSWKLVSEFLTSLPAGSTLLDAGCGNGKYLVRKDALSKFGCDISGNLLRIAALQKGCAVFRADTLQLPIRSGSFDSALSIAVIHHFSTQSRRLKVIAELLRILRPGGFACVTAWALEQTAPDSDIPSLYMSKMCTNKFENDQQQQKLPDNKLRIHEGKQFVQQDLLVPWSSSVTDQKDGEFSDKRSNDKDFFRYYHLFVRGELAELVRHFAHCCVLESEQYDEGNWVVVFRKTH